MKISKIKELGVTYQSILIYAPSGMGKTTVISKLKGKTLLIDCDRGSSVLTGLDRDDFDVIRLDSELTDLPKILEMLEKKCDYINVAVDTLSELEKSMLTILGRLGKMDGIPELQAYNKVQYKLIDYVRRFRALPCNVIFSCWEQSKEFIANDGTKTNHLTPLLSGKTCETVLGLVDVVAHLEISTKEETKGKRFLRLETTNNIIAKDRLNKRSYCEIDQLI
jgi:phage nucleotide-binding protein